MAELTPQERLQPSLLDRLTDDDPHNPQESREQRVLSMSKLRDSVMRDLVWLFNAVNLTATEDLDAYPLVARSVVNYGLPDLAGKAAVGMDVADIERLLRQAIWDFEPRILRNSVKVRAILARDEMNHNAIGFDIEGELWAQPLPLHLYLKTELDLADGSVRVVNYTAAEAG
jgi:type VI secretion system protein ImpF